MIKAKRDELLAPLAAVSGIIERRHTLPILSNVLIDGSGDALSFLATDIEIQINARSGLAAAKEARALTVGARKLLDILRALPEDAEVSLQPRTSACSSKPAAAASACRRCPPRTSRGSPRRPARSRA